MRHLESQPELPELLTPATYTTRLTSSQEHPSKTLHQSRSSLLLIPQRGSNLVVLRPSPDWVARSTSSKGGRRLSVV